MSSYNKEFPVSWEELHRSARALAWRLATEAKAQKFDKIVAVTRGGLIPAAIIARELEIRLIDTVCVASYDHQALGTSKVLKAVEGDGENCLIIDDLVDTGTTSQIVREMLPKAYFATVFAKPQGKPMVDCFVTEVSQDTWILFPWDVEMTYATPIGNRKLD